MNPTRKSFLLSVVLLCWPHICKSQDVQIEKVADEHGGYFMKWDTVQDRLTAYRNTKDAAAPAALVYGADGHSLPVYPQRDLAESVTVNLWDVAATPEGGLVLVGLVGYGPPPRLPSAVKSVLLSYGPAGDLRKVWNVSPYEFDLVAVDGQGNVYGLGNADLEEPYFMLVKYSPEGRVLRQFLSTDQFPLGHHILSPGGGMMGENRMFVAGNGLDVWFARTQELLRFSLSGDLLSRVSLAHSLSQLATANGERESALLSVAPGGGNQIIADAYMWDKQSPKTPGKRLLVQLSTDGSLTAPLGVGLGENRFLGSSSIGKVILLEPSSGIVKAY